MCILHPYLFLALSVSFPSLLRLQRDEIVLESSWKTVGHLSLKETCFCPSPIQLEAFRLQQFDQVLDCGPEVAPDGQTDSRKSTGGHFSTYSFWDWVFIGL